MSSESELEQYEIDSGSEEEQTVGSESEEEESDIEMEEQEEEASEAEEDEDEEEEIGEEASKAENESETDSDSEPEEVSSKPPTKKKEKIPFDQPKSEEKNNILEKYEKLKGKSLFVRFPHALTKDQAALEKELKDLCSRIIKVRRPRQNRTRFCLVDFDSTEDRTKAMKELKNVEINGQKLYIDIPKTEKEGFIEQLMEKRAQNKAAKKAKAKLKKAAKKNKKIAEAADSSAAKKPEKIYTSTLVVHNIPSESTANDIKGIFPTAIDIQVNFAKSTQNTTTATVTFPTPKDATRAKKKKYTIGESNLRVSFANTKKSKNIQKNKAKHGPSKENGQPENGSPDIKLGKHKLSEPSSSEVSSPKKKKKFSMKSGGEKTFIELKKQDDNLETVKKKIFKKKQKDGAIKEIIKSKESNAAIKGPIRKTGEIVQKADGSHIMQKKQKVMKLKKEKSGKIVQKGDGSSVMQKKEKVIKLKKEKPGKIAKKGDGSAVMQKKEKVKKFEKGKPGKPFSNKMPKIK